MLFNLMTEKGGYKQPRPVGMVVYLLGYVRQDFTGNIRRSFPPHAPPCNCYCSPEMIAV